MIRSIPVREYQQEVEPSGGIRPLLLGMSWFPDVSGGLNRYLADLQVALTTDGAGPPPRALVLGPCADPPPGVVAVSGHRQPLPLRWLHLLRAASRLAKNADLVDAHFALYALPIVFGPARRLPLVVHFQGPWAAESSSVGAKPITVAAKRWVERQVYHRAVGAVTLSHAFKRILVESYGVAPWCIDVVPPPVNLDRFCPGNRIEARRRLGIPLDAVVVSTIRRLVPRMGIAVLLRAWSKALPAISGRALLVVAGDGPEEGSLRRLADDLSMNDQVRFVGRLSDSDLVDLYRASDAAIVPSLELEGFGLVVLEAMACGTPVIATRVGGLPEALRGIDPSALVPAGDVDALAFRMIGAFDESSRLPSGKRCRVHAETFSPTKVAARHREIYARAARHQRQHRLRVVYLDHCALESGGELALLRLLVALDEVDAHIILGADGPLVDRLTGEGISVEVLPMSGAARNLRKDTINSASPPFVPAVLAAGYAARIAHRLHQLKPDLVHTNSLKSAIYGGLAARAAGIPVIWHIRDRIDTDYLPKAAVHLIRSLSRVLPNAIIANSQSTMATLPAHSCAGTVIASPVVQDARPRPPARNRMSEQDLRIAMIGRLAPWKGQHLFIDAFLQAFPANGATATIVGGALFGETDYERDLHQHVNDLGLTGRVELIGHLDSTAEILGACDVAVHASITPEPFGSVVVEAMAAGLAVVAANAGGPAEIITHDVNGLLFVPGSATALATALGRLQRDPALRRRLGTAARVRASDFEPQTIARRVVAVYQGALARPLGQEHRPQHSDVA